MIARVKRKKNVRYYYRFRYTAIYTLVFVVLAEAYLNVVIAVVVQVEDPVDLAVLVDVYVFRSLQTLANGLPCVFFHLNVIELSVGAQKKKDTINKIISLSYDKKIIIKTGCGYVYDIIIYHYIAILYV